LRWIIEDRPKVHVVIVVRQWRGCRKFMGLANAALPPDTARARGKGAI
jgi:hypothetical protein